MPGTARVLICQEWPDFQTPPQLLLIKAWCPTRRQVLVTEQGYFSEHWQCWLMERWFYTKLPLDFQRGDFTEEKIPTEAVRPKESKSCLQAQQQFKAKAFDFQGLEIYNLATTGGWKETG